jgi:hypothetical protein
MLGLRLGQSQSIITTVAGKGRILAGIGGPAADMLLADPKGLAIDSKGNLYIADNIQNVVFRVVGQFEIDIPAMFCFEESSKPTISAMLQM